LEKRGMKEKKAKCICGASAATHRKVQSFHLREREREALFFFLKRERGFVEIVPTL